MAGGAFLMHKYSENSGGAKTLPLLGPEVIISLPPSRGQLLIWPHCLAPTVSLEWMYCPSPCLEAWRACKALSLLLMSQLPAQGT